MPLQEFYTISKSKGIWITGNTLQDFTDNLIARLQKNGMTVENPSAQTPLFGEYLKTFLETFKSRQQPTTVINRQRLIDKHVLPVLGNMPIGEITTAFCQRWFDRLCDEGYSKETLLKIKNSVSPAFDSAVADGYIRMNPFKDKARFKINTEKGEHHKAIPPELFQSAKAKLHELPERERYMMALLCYTGMRFEEVLGVRWEDIYDDEIHVERAVVHPKRNQPIVKVPKTKSSRRKIPVVKQLLNLLEPGDKSGYIVGGEKPLSYQQAKKSFEKARKILGLEGFTAHDFRDTCATVWRESGMQMEHISKLLGHAKTAVTEQCYVKFRQQSLDAAKGIMELAM